MPGIPLVTRETTVHITADQMYRHSRVHLSAEEEAAADESLAQYGKPVELYNILQRRAAKNPWFLQRCLHYKIQERRKKRIQMGISIPPTLNNEEQLQSLFPIYVVLAKQIPSDEVTKDSQVYRVSKICTLTSFSNLQGSSQPQSKFLLPELTKLSEGLKSDPLVILFISCAQLKKNQTDPELFPSNFTGTCLLGKIFIAPVHLSDANIPNVPLGERDEMLFTPEMYSQYLKTSSLDGDRSITFQTPPDTNEKDLTMFEEMNVSITVEEIGAKGRTSYDKYPYYNDNPTTSSPSNILRLRNGNVVFHFRYYNNTLVKTEVTENFACAICLINCVSYKGLRCHLSAFHDRFSYEFWITEEYQAVNVTMKPEIVLDNDDPKKQTFIFCSKPLKRKKIKTTHQTALDVQQLVPASHYGLQDNIEDLVDTTMDCVEHHSSDDNDNNNDNNNNHDIVEVSYVTPIPQTHVEPDYGQSSAMNIIPPLPMLQFAKTRRLSVHSDNRSRSLLQMRQFFHSHKAQPMTLEQLVADQDSEDEVDDDVADLEDRRILDDFVDVTKDEKKMMHLWNSFVRKQRVLADGHVNWACEAFIKKHGREFVKEPSVLWCWRLFMIKLSNHGLLDARTMNNCNLQVEKYQKAEKEKENAIQIAEPQPMQTMMN